MLGNQMCSTVQMEDLIYCYVKLSSRFEQVRSGNHVMSVILLWSVSVNSIVILGQELNKGP